MSNINNLFPRSLENFKLPITSGVVGIAIGILTRNVLKKETIHVNSMNSTVVSFVSIAAGTAIAEQILMMDRGGGSRE